MRYLLLQLFLIVVSVAVTAQPLPRELIVEWAPERVGEKRAFRAAPLRQRRLSGDRRYELLVFADAAAAAAATRHLRTRPEVLHVQPNVRVAFRNQPDDPLYASRQGNLARAGFETAWNLTVGGETAEGEPIVVAVLDAGFDVGHEDLAPSLWRNPAEVPADGLDNDGNGLVDDVHGWNFAGDRAGFQPSSHGTQVAGLLGAAGDNDLGISGTNWNSRLMLFGINTVADIIAAYDYVAVQRELYNASGGARGALVVATNASFGLEGATCDDYPVWAGLYDRLGAAGVLTAASTANRSWDVDLNGDMPTDCPTEYIVGVANLGPTDRLHTSSGYGAGSVDLTAPGEGSYSLLPNDRYGNFGSTSAAAPYVTGAIALLYATPCPALAELRRRDPAAAALTVRAALLAGVRPLPSLQLRTASGGTLDVGAAQAALADFCGLDAAGALAVERVYPNPASATVRLELTGLAPGTALRLGLYDVLGRRTAVPGFTLRGTAPVVVEFSVSSLPAGWYALEVVGREQRALTTLVVR